MKKVRQSEQAKTLESIVDDWLESFDNKNTRENYSRAIRFFLSSVCTSQSLNALSSITASDIEIWKENLNRNFAPSTVNVRIATVRSFFSFLMRTDHPSANVDLLLGGTTPISATTRKPRRAIVEPERIEELLQTIDPTDTIGARDLALLTVLFRTACKVDEVISLFVGSYEKDQKGASSLLFEDSKYPNPRAVPLNSITSSAIDNWLHMARHASNTSPLFTPCHNGVIHQERLSRVTVYRILKKNASNIGLEETLNPRTLHAAALLALKQSGMSIEGVQQITGTGLPTLQRRFPSRIRWQEIVDKWNGPEDAKQSFAEYKIPEDKWRSSKWLLHQADSLPEEGGVGRSMRGLLRAICDRFRTFNIFKACMDGHLPFNEITSRAQAKDLLREEILHLRSSGKWIQKPTKGNRVTKAEWEEITKPEWYKKNPVVRAVADYLNSQKEEHD